MLNIGEDDVQRALSNAPLSKALPAGNGSSLPKTLGELE